jgi:ubiquinone/menaquinone biosynthesis C-methylase UbiE
MSNVSPEAFYNALTVVLCELFGHDWHLGYWLNADTMELAGERLNAVMAARLPAGAGLEILDVGCGVGGPACFIARQTGSRVTGVSNSPAGLEEANRFVRTQGVDSLVTFRFGEFQQLPFNDASFDAVWSCEAIHNLVDKTASVREMARVLKPGGTAVIGDLFLLSDPGPADQAQLAQFSFHLTTAPDFIQLLQREGIGVVESIDVGHLVGPESPQRCAKICGEKLAATPEPGLQRTILERTIMATNLLARLFTARTIGWGIWTGRRDRV